jgi:hypothetical protein
LVGAVIQEPYPEWPDREEILKGYELMRREPEQRTIRGKGPGPDRPKDPERKGGDGRSAMGTRKDGGTERGRPERPKDPERGKGDGMKIAARGEAGKASKLQPSKAERQRVR